MKHIIALHALLERTILTLEAVFAFLAQQVSTTRIKDHRSVSHVLQVPILVTLEQHLIQTVHFATLEIFRLLQVQQTVKYAFQVLILGRVQEHVNYAQLELPHPFLVLHLARVAQLEVFPTLLVHLHVQIVQEALFQH